MQLRLLLKVVIFLPAALLACSAVQSAKAGHSALVATQQTGEGSTAGKRREDLLSSLGIAVTGGAAPGYVEDGVCAACHPRLYRSYQEVGMARSFATVTSAKPIEDFENNHFFHERSKRHYEMIRRDGGILFKRYQLDADGKQINVFEQEVDWILGSGSRSRTYLYRTPSGELYQLPLAWYSQTQSWRMAPGYDGPEHEGVNRLARQECMFCHNAYPDVPKGSDRYGQPPLFPKALPEGIGCQRCHGPGAEHVRIAFSGGPELARLRSSIVNPGRLDVQHQKDICYGCHMQPSVAIFGVRRLGRSNYSFRPGQLLSDYLVELDVVEVDKPRSERFEINHHPYRLEQSRCFQRSQGALTCLTCHDPHRKVSSAKRAEHYRDACLSCHRQEECGRDGMEAQQPGGRHHSQSRATASAQPAPGGNTEQSGEVDTSMLPPRDTQDCVSCHMPRRRTQDVVQVVMTDHLIQRQPGDKNLLEPLEESDPILAGVEFLRPDTAPRGPLGDIYRAAAVLRTGAGSHHVVEHLETMLKRAQPAQYEPYLDLARGQLKQKRFAAAEATLTALLERDPDQPQALAWLAIAQMGQGKLEGAAQQFRHVLNRYPDHPEVTYNYGLLLAAQGQRQQAIQQFRRALEARPNLAAAWYHLGRIQSEAGDFEKATHALKKALEVDPTHTRAYLAISEALLGKGERAEALRYLRHGSQVAHEPELVTAALEKLLSSQQARAVHEKRD